MDVLVSAIALLAFTRIESKRVQIRSWWIVLVAVLSVGVSLGLPLLLLLRERELERNPVLADVNHPDVLNIPALFRINCGTFLLPGIVLIL